ncbi:MAG TPA: TMEM175 family protein [Streptosporangiaceae bacterium]
MADDVAEPPAGAATGRDPASPAPAHPARAHPAPAGPRPDHPAPDGGNAAHEHAHARRGLLALYGNLAYDRVLFFSDAVFAIAITLLVVDIRVPSTAGGTINSATELHAALPEIRSFGISFAVIGLFWLGHHGMFLHITVLNRTLMLLNLLFLATIAFLPYPTALFSAASNQVAATVFYASCVAAAGLVEAAIWVYAISAPSLMRGRVDPKVRRYYLARLLPPPLVFAATIPVALASPQTASYLWLTIVVLGGILRRTMSPQEKAGETWSA